jgi:hypothetical protein
VLTRVLMFALSLMASDRAIPRETHASPPQQGQSQWLKRESQRFEIHYQPALAGDLDRVIRSAEAAYDRVSGKLRFVLGSKVPLVIFDPAGPMTSDEVAAFARSDQVTPPQPHRSRIVLPLPADDGRLDALMIHELAHLLMSEIILPGRGGDGGLPRWVHEGVADYMVGTWTDDDERLLRDLVAAGRLPAMSQLTGSGPLADARLDDALGHAAFDYIESRWGETAIRGFLNALIVPRVDRTYDAVFGLTPAHFDSAFRQYVERRFK